MTHKLAHHSGRYDNNLITEGFEKTRRDCSFASWTEFGTDRRAAELREAAKRVGWGMYQHNERGFDDLAFTWDQSRWRYLDAAGKVLSEIQTWSTTGNQRPPLCAQAVLMQSIADRTKWAMVTMHSPSHVSVWDGWRRDSNRIRQYKDGMNTMSTWVRELDKQWPQHGFVLAADWNAPMERPWFRAFLEETMPKSWKVMGPNPHAPEYPDTHDNRCIDWAMLSPRVRKSGHATAVAMPDSDHKTLFYGVDLIA